MAWWAFRGAMIGEEFAENLSVLMHKRLDTENGGREES
jgi:hypothetical protein